MVARDSDDCGCHQLVRLFRILRWIPCAYEMAAPCYSRHRPRKGPQNERDSPGHAWGPLSMLMLRRVCSRRASNTITFLCGHSFHMTCIKDWCKKHSQDGEKVDDCPGRCPICTNPAAQSEEAAAESFPVEIELSTYQYSDCARLFALQNLSERYPDVFTKDDSQRMLTQSTAVLFADSQFAKSEPQPNWLALLGWPGSSREKASA